MADTNEPAYADVWMLFDGEKQGITMGTSAEIFDLYEKRRDETFANVQKEDTIDENFQLIVSRVTREMGFEPVNPDNVDEGYQMYEVPFIPEELIP